ncbi:MAG: DEAD/DEAH box helicase [Candidatus Omnitrophica bacterium]|nr:DEAD/DEAH box helicase [Candidatus Omnitrophota bacterium]MBU4458089.1 DEAD/DEAH box helicase [Candidatus Omnitrophota bacterium]
MIYDAFQKKAIDYIKEGHSVIVSAPTGAGKTVIAEYIINDCLQKGDRVIYTAPIKALSNQKYRDFQENFPEKIGILTGDVSINPSAPILIMTTEIFRNKVLEEKSNIGSYSWIIFDEVHYLDDYERGSVWEESLIFLPQHMKMLALSATIPNIDELASWLKSIHKMPLKIVKETKRPVPLHFFYQAQGEIFDNLHEVNSTVYKRQAYYRHGRPNRPTSLIRLLSENNKLPCIYFAFGRKRCEYLAGEMMRFDFLNQGEKSQIIGLYNELSERFDLSNDKSAQAMAPLIEKGFAFHHAGMLPTLKEVIERLFTSRLIKVIFTTETFALGINMPARTVIFDELRKFYGKYFATLKTRDFYQMAGRAGRRGIDEEGFVYTRVNPKYTLFHELHRVVYGTPEKVLSRFNASYATILNLYERYGEKLYEIYPLSFHYFQAKIKLRKKAVELLRNKVKILKELGYIRKNKITEKGIFASKIYGYELSLSELYEKGVLENLSETELGILCVALVFEPRKASILPGLSGHAKRLRNITDNIVAKIQKIEKGLNIKPFSKTYYYHLSPAIEAWMKKEEFDHLLRHTNADEGEIIRQFRMAVQILRELLDTPTSTEFREKVKKVIYLINRDIIDAERQLRS